MRARTFLAVLLLAFSTAVSAQVPGGLEIPNCRSPGNDFTGDGVPPVKAVTYASLRYPGVDKEEIAALLQAMVDEVHGKGFRFLGDSKDFFHGHLLFSRGAKKPAAVLYHTQEAARHEHKRDPGGRYDYLNRDARNWLQRLPGRRVENAVLFVRSSYPDDAAWSEFKRNCLPVYLEARTVTPLMLDPAVLPDLEREFQFNFLAVDCSCAAVGDPASNAVELKLPGGPSACVLLGTNGRSR